MKKMVNIAQRFGDRIGRRLQDKIQTYSSDVQELQMCLLRSDIL